MWLTEATSGATSDRDGYYLVRPNICWHSSSTSEFNNIMVKKAQLPINNTTEISLLFIISYCLLLLYIISETVAEATSNLYLYTDQDIQFEKMPRGRKWVALWTTIPLVLWKRSYKLQVKRTNVKETAPSGRWMRWEMDEKRQGDTTQRERSK